MWLSVVGFVATAGLCFSAFLAPFVMALVSMILNQTGVSSPGNRSLAYTRVSSGWTSRQVHQFHEE